MNFEFSMSFPPPLYGVHEFMDSLIYKDELYRLAAGHCTHPAATKIDRVHELQNS
jgi:hypothetical protein